MGKKKDISVDVKQIISNLINKKQFAQYEIADIANVSVGTVSNVAKKLRLGEDVTRSNRVNCYGKRKTTIKEDRIIMKIAKKDRRLSSKVICNELTERNINISERSVRRRLFDAGLKARRPFKKQFLNKKMKEKRLKWARKYQNWSIAQWENVSHTHYVLCLETMLRNKIYLKKL